MNDINFDEIIQPIINMYQKLEYNLLIQIATHFENYEEIGFKNSMEWYIKKIEELGGLNNEAIEIIAKESNISKEKIMDMLKEAGIEITDRIPIKELNATGMYDIDIDVLMASDTFNDVLNNSYKTINDTFRMINTKALEASKSTYMNVLNETYTKVRTGISYNTAIRQALNDMAKKGIKVVSYRQSDGKVRQYSIESCVRRDTLTAIVQATNRMSDVIGDDLHTEYWEVSQHLGARVTNTHDYKDHSWWQGKVYKIDGSTKEYPNFQETCNEGDVQGIGGANCRHIKWAFFPGISTPKSEKIDPEENARAYKLSQEQRSYERDTRNLKKRIGVAKASGDTEYYDELKGDLKDLDNEFNKFCKDNNLKRDYNREMVI